MRRLILGGPGCGKTTRLLEILGAEMAAGVRPERIAYVSFTRAAVREAVDRARARHGFTRKQLPYFRTLHSLGFYLMGLDRQALLGPDDYARIGEAAGLRFEGTTDADQGLPTGRLDGDRALFQDALARSRGIPLREQFNRGGHRLRWPLVEYTANTVARYKTEHGLYDYQDMIDGCHGPLDVDVAIIDEAQDLTTAQWHMIERVFGRTPRVYYGGDDDQAIYAWAGADVGWFLSLDAEREVLPRSHRLPRHVWDVANRQASRIGQRYVKHWEPATEGGDVERVARFAAIDFTREGTWLVLARNRHVLNDAERHLRERGLVFEGAVRRSHVDAIRGWEKLRRGQDVPEAQRTALDRYVHRPMPSFDTDWTEALSRIPDRERAYYANVKRAGRRVTDEPRIRLSTIHAVKGAEADHVVLLTDLAARTHEAMTRDPDGEHRVWYVAITRARQSLYVMKPATERAYRIFL